MRALVVGWLCLCGAAAAACGGPGAAPSPAVGDHGRDAAESGGEAEPVVDWARRCEERLGRFGPEAVSAELEDCVATFTTSRELRDCEASGLGQDYVSCVESCMSSVDLGGEYVPGDVVSNCQGPCHQVTCADQAP